MTVNNSSIQLNDPNAARIGTLRPSINIGAETDAIPGYPLDFGVKVDGDGIHPRFIWNENLTKLAHDTFGEERFENGFKTLQDGIGAINKPIRDFRIGLNRVLDGYPTVS